MEKAVLISIRPEWCEKIANGKKTIEVRKTRPKIDTPFKCFIYCTNNEPLWKKDNWVFTNKHYNRLLDTFDYMLNGKVIGEFVCDDIWEFGEIVYGYGFYYFPSDSGMPETCLTEEQMWEYGKGKILYGWHISDLVIYDKPKELSEFKGRKLVWRGDNPILDYEDIKRPPQSWCYVKGEVTE